MSKQSFIETMRDGYSFEGESLLMWKAKLAKELVDEAEIKIPLKTLNRHGLIAGATGTGKTKSVQLLCEWLSLAGVPSLVMDIKGDLSGLAKPWDPTNKHIISRHEALQIPYEAMGFPVELMSLSQEHGVPLRATVSEFWPLLLSKILDLNETQTSVMGVIFKYCDDRALGLVDLKDMKAVIQFLMTWGAEEVEKEYGHIAEATLSTIIRKIVALEQQGADTFFGEPSFEVFDLLRNEWGKGVVNIVRLVDMQEKPALFSTFMMSLLAELYHTFPEAGDLDKPRLVMVIDEAHLLFKNASKELLSQLETIIKLIRSKGIGIFFCTQLPDDVPPVILSQLWCKIQHALRWFTERDRKAIKTAVENYPVSDFYKTDELIMELWIGEAFITCLNEKWIPTPLAHAYLRAPRSRMDVLTPSEIEALTKTSLLVQKYKNPLDPESAFEKLQKEIKDKIAAEDEKKWEGILGKGTVGKILESKIARNLAKEVGNMLVRWLLGALWLKVDKRRNFF